jgi:NADH dehydrogenase FAD-containing subunit
MGDKFSRRDFIKISAAGGAAASTGVIASEANAQAAVLSRVAGRAADLPKPGGTRLVVVGGGWAGLTVAKYAKREDPKLDVVLIEPRAIFQSCPISNLWLADLVDYDFITHSFLDAARNNGYNFFNATVVDVDRDARRVFTEQGYVDYDFLVLAPGIDYDYASLGVSDPGDVAALRTRYPAGFKPGSEHISIKNKIADFEGGVFLLTVPGGNYRCLPAPYERTCLIAATFKKNKIKGKVVLLDMNPDITIKGDGFHAAFDELYPDHVEYVPQTTITGIDVAKKTVHTEFDSYTFDDAAIYPRVRAAELIETLGLISPNSLQKEANIDPFGYNVIGDERTYVVGDSRPMPFSKSGNTARSEGKYVAKVIAGRANDRQVAWESPHTICYSVVSAEPMQAIMVDAYYAHDGTNFGFDRVNMVQERDEALALATLEWARGHYRDMFT